MQLKGTVYHGLFSGGEKFNNVMQFLLIVENILDSTGFPKSTTEKRRFYAFQQSEPTSEVVNKGTDFSTKKGDLATFRLKVMFRHNASWQGAIAWMEGNNEEPFRSALELLMLMHSAFAN
jgi:hypothetical protein